MKQSDDPVSSRPVKEYPENTLLTLPGAGKTVDLKLVSKSDVSADTRIFRFALPSDEHVLGLPVGQHVAISFSDTLGARISRPYTPITSDDDVGFVDFCIKVYDQGLMTTKLDSLSPGDSMTFEGPLGNVTYTDRSEFTLYDATSSKVIVRSDVNHLGMICGGTGITPMLQVIRQIFKDVGDTTRVSLLFANRTPSDVLMKAELDELAETHPNLSVHYTVDNARDENWDGSIGFVDADMIKEHLPAAGPNVQVLLCGPPAMTEKAVIPALEKLGFTKEMYMQF